MDCFGIFEFFYFIVYLVGIKDDFWLYDLFFIEGDLQDKFVLNIKLCFVYIEVQFR